MKMSRCTGRSLSIACLLLIPALLVSCQRKRDISTLPGIWNGTVYLQSNDEVPVQLELRVEGQKVIGEFINGDERIRSTSGGFDGRTLRLRFDYFDAEFTGDFVRREVIGRVVRTWHQKKLERDIKIWKGGGQMIVPAAAEGSDLSGEWEMKVGEGDKQRTWRLVLSQKEARLTGTIVTPSGDWGVMTGSIGYGKMQLSRFDIINARLLRARINDKGQLEGSVDLGQGDPARKVVADRVSSGQPSSTDIANQPRVLNPSEVLRFSGLDLDGKTIDQTDPRFKGKVVVLEISGTWCPNCYDAAPLLNSLFIRYQDKGLTIASLSFEYTGDVKRDLEQVRIFARRYDIKYLSLLAGTTEGDDISRKLPQIVNLNAYPTTIFVGRDGRVRKIHAGFEGPATGERHQRLKSEFETTITELLSEK